MYNSKQLRTAVRGLLLDSISNANVLGYTVANEIEKTGADKYCVFSVRPLTTIDERESINLEVNIICPQNESDEAEKLADTFDGDLDRSVNVCTNFIFYIYKSTRNRIDDDAHMCRYRLTYDLYLYERN